MRYHFSILGFLFFSVITICLSRRLNSRDKRYLTEVIGELKGAPAVEEITGGRVTVLRRVKKYVFSYTSDEGHECQAQVTMRKNGSGGHSWQCTLNPDSEDYDDLRRRGLKGKLNKNKNYKLEGEGTHKPKIEEGNQDGKTETEE